MYARVTWEGEQVVSGQEKAGLPPLGGGSQEEDGLWEGRPGSQTGHPSLTGIEGQTGQSNQEEQNRHPIYYQDQVSTWGCVTATKVKPKETPVAKPDS